MATVLGLHVIVVWLLWATPRLRSMPARWKALDIVLIPPMAAREVPFQAAPRSQAPDNSPLRRRTRAAPLPTKPAAPTNDENAAAHPPIDWAAELARAGERAAPDEPNHVRNFGFPHASNPAPAKAPEFDWSYARTHRVESLPGGGILVHLNDNCVLVLFPFPFVGCSIGKRKANGDLFEHMHDPSPSSDTNAQ